MHQIKTTIFYAPLPGDCLIKSGKNNIWNVTIATNVSFATSTSLPYRITIFSRDMTTAHVVAVCSLYTEHIHKHTEVWEQINSRRVAMHKVTAQLFLAPEFHLHYHSCHLCSGMKDGRFFFVLAQSCWPHTDKLYPVVRHTTGHSCRKTDHRSNQDCLAVTSQISKTWVIIFSTLLSGRPQSFKTYDLKCSP